MIFQKYIDVVYIFAFISIALQFCEDFSVVQCDDFFVEHYDDFSVV